MSERELAYNYVRRALAEHPNLGDGNVITIRQTILHKLLSSAFTRSGLTGQEPELSEQIVHSLMTPDGDDLHRGLLGDVLVGAEDPPDEMLRDPALIGWCYQILNQPLRDAGSWAISRSAENQAESVQIGVVTQLFTDDYIADFLVDRCFALLARKSRCVGASPVLCDPACGVGHILLAAVKRTALLGQPIASLQSSLWGFDIDPSAVRLTRALLFLQMVLSGYDGDLAQLWHGLQERIVCLDAPRGTLDRSANKGRAFDIVITNPPYLGRRKLPSAMRNFLDREYPAAKGDLFAAFMQRCIELTAPGGAIGLLTPDKWIRLRGYAHLRDGQGDFNGILGELSIAMVCELGERAFHPTTALHDGVKAAILCGVRETPSSNHRLTWARLSKFDSYREKIAALNALQANRIAGDFSVEIEQHKWQRCGTSAILLQSSGLPDALTGSRATVKQYADVVVGIQTNSDDRYVRFVWQIPPGTPGWRIHLKGGGYARWGGLNRWVIDWQSGSAHFFKTADARSRAEAWAAREGWCYTWFANGALGLRPKRAGWSFGRAAASGVFCADDRIIAFLNSRHASMASRVTGGKIQLPEGVVRELPAPESLEHILPDTIDWITLLKAGQVSRDIADALFDPKCGMGEAQALALQALTLAVEGMLESQVERCLGMTINDSESFSDGVGPPVGWFGLGGGIASHPLWEFIPKRYHGVKSILDTDRACPRLQPATGVRNDDGLVRAAILGKARDYKRPYILPSNGIVEHVCRMWEMHPFDAVLRLIRLAEIDDGVFRALYLPEVCSVAVKELLSALGHRWWTEEKATHPGYARALEWPEVCAIVQASSARCGLARLVGDSPEQWIRKVLIPWQERKFLKASPIQVVQGNNRCMTLTHRWWSSQATLERHEAAAT